MTSKKKKTITGLGPVHTDRDIFETAYFVIQISVDRDQKPLWNEVSNRCCFGKRFHWFRAKADSFRKYVVSKISGLEWSWPNNQNNNSARASCFFVHYFCRHCTTTTCSRFMEDVKVQKVLLHVVGTTVFNADFQWDTALQHCCNPVLNSCNIDPILQRCTSVAQSSLRIVSWNITLKKKERRNFLPFLSWKLNFLRNSSPGEFAYIRVTIIAVKIERNANWLFKWRLRRRCSPRISRTLVSTLY